MTSAQQNGLESKTDRRRKDLHFEWFGPRTGKTMGRQAPLNKSDVVSQLGGLKFQTVLADSQASDFRFKRLSRNPESCSGA
jgi:hypothetical protein